MRMDLSNGDEVDIRYAQTGEIVITKEEKKPKVLKAAGMLHKYADPSKIPLEKYAFKYAMERKYGKKIK